MDSEFSGRITLRARKKLFRFVISNYTICVYIEENCRNNFSSWGFGLKTFVFRFFHSSRSIFLFDSVVYLMHANTIHTLCDVLLLLLYLTKNPMCAYNIAWYGFWSQNVLFDNRLTDRENECVRTAVCMCLRDAEISWARSGYSIIFRRRPMVVVSAFVFAFAFAFLVSHLPIASEI